MLGKKTLRLVTAALLVGLALGAQVPTAHRATAATVVSITDWQFPAGCNTNFANQAVTVEACAAETYDSIWAFDQNLKYFPDLAQNIPTRQNGEVKVVNGNLVLTIKLKPNLKWSDGTPLTADDVVFSYPVDLKAGSWVPAPLKSIKAIDAHTVQETFDGQYGAYLAYGQPSPVLPKHYLVKKYGTSDPAKIALKFANDPYNSPSDVNSGPYMVKSFTANQSVVLVQNPYYNALPAAPGHPRPSQIKFVAVTNEANALAQDLQSAHAGVDAAEDFQTDNLPVLSAAKHYHVHNLPGLFVEFLNINESGVLRNVRLRRALQLAVPKVTLYHQLFPTVRNPADFVLRTMTPLPNTFRDKTIPISKYDPAQALSLLKSAGYSTGCSAPGPACYNAPGKHLQLRFAATQTSTRQKNFQILNRYWAAVGIHVTPRFGQASGNFGIYDSWAHNGILQRGSYDVILMGYTESPDPAQSTVNYDPSQIPSASLPNGQNVSRIRDADQFKLLLASTNSLDLNQRLSLYHKWERMINDRVYQIPLYNRSFISADNGSIGNYKPSPAQTTNEWNVFEWYKKAAS
jgi:peptide/nickel transport system substrate-binding protein